MSNAYDTVANDQRAVIKLIHTLTENAHLKTGMLPVSTAATLIRTIFATREEQIAERMKAARATK